MPLLRSRQQQQRSFTIDAPPATHAQKGRTGGGNENTLNPAQISRVLLKNEEKAKKVKKSHAPNTTPAATSCVLTHGGVYARLFSAADFCTCVYSDSPCTRACRKLLGNERFRGRGGELKKRIGTLKHAPLSYTLQGGSSSRRRGRLSLYPARGHTTVWCRRERNFLKIIGADAQRRLAARCKV